MLAIQNMMWNKSRVTPSASALLGGLVPSCAARLPNRRIKSIFVKMVWPTRAVNVGAAMRAFRSSL